MIWPPPCSSIPLQMVICKEDGSPDDQKQGDEGAGIVANDHPDDPVSSISLQMVTCKEDCPPNDQNQRNGEAWIVANDHLDDLASSVLFCSFANKRFALFTWSIYIQILFQSNDISITPIKYFHQNSFAPTNNRPGPISKENIQ